MEQLVDKSTLQVLATKETRERWGGPIGEAIERGDYAWATVPAGVDPRDTVAVAGPPVSVVEDAAKKAARLASESDEATRRTQALTALQAIRDFDESTVADASIRSWMRNVKRVLTYVIRAL